MIILPPYIHTIRHTSTQHKRISYMMRAHTHTRMYSRNHRHSNRTINTYRRARRMARGWVTEKRSDALSASNPTGTTAAPTCIIAHNGKCGMYVRELAVTMPFYQNHCTHQQSNNAFRTNRKVSRTARTKTISRYVRKRERFQWSKEALSIVALCPHWAYIKSIKNNASLWIMHPRYNFINTTNTLAYDAIPLLPSEYGIENEWIQCGVHAVHGWHIG